jgi:hypothetical protein
LCWSINYALKVVSYDSILSYIFFNFSVYLKQSGRFLNTGNRWLSLCKVLRFWWWRRFKLRCSELCCLQPQREVLKTTGILPQQYTVSQHWRPKLERWFSPHIWDVTFLLGKIFWPIHITYSYRTNNLHLLWAHRTGIGGSKIRPAGLGGPWNWPWARAMNKVPNMTFCSIFT